MMVDYEAFYARIKKESAVVCNMPQAKSEYASVDDLTRRLSEGKFSITLNGWKFYCLFMRGETRNLTVFFNGASPRKPGDIGSPIFNRWPYKGVISGSVLCIADPMLARYPEIRLGWYYGDRKCLLLQLTLQVIQAVCRHEKIYDLSHITLFGTSGGGYAALLAGAIMNGGNSLAINPQVYPSEYFYAKTFEELTGLNLRDADVFHRNELPSLMKKSCAKFVVLGNLSSHDDCENQLMHMASFLDIKPKYGISAKENICLWMYNGVGAPEPHNSQDMRTIFPHILRIALEFCHNGLSDDLRKDALLCNEYLDMYWKLRKELYELEV